MLEARAADRNLYLVIKSNKTEPVVNDERGEFHKGQEERESRASKGRSAASSACKSHHNYSRLHTGKQTAHVGGENVERQGEKLELNEPEMKINFCPVDNRRLELTSHVQGYWCKFTPWLIQGEEVGYCPRVGWHNVDAGQALRFS